MKKKKEFYIKGSIVSKLINKNQKEGYSFEIGSVDASLDDSMMTKEMNKVLLEIGERLCKQMKCDAICFNSLSFQRMWLRKKS